MYTYEIATVGGQGGGPGSSRPLPWSWCSRGKG